MSSSSVESYPPTLGDLRKSFLALRPDYEFGIIVFKTEAGMEFRYHAPKEPIGGTSVWGNPLPPSIECHAEGRRCQEWINYIWNQTKLMAAEANITTLYIKEADVLPRRMIGDGCEPPPIFRLIRVEDAYFQLCSRPEITPAKRLAREQVREEKIRMERARETELAEAKKRHETELAKRSKKISSLATKASLTEQEAEAILAYFIPTDTYSPDIHFKFKKDTLLALKVLNRFATEHKIRVEDAMTVFREYIS